MQKSGNDPEVFDEIIHQGVLGYFGGETSDEIALVLIPGDLVVNGNSYGQWANDFFAPSHDLFSHVPVYPVLGNHEVNTPYYFQYFHLPDNGTDGYEEHWWYKDYGNVRFLGLDSNGPYDGPDQLAWLDGVLETTCGLEHIDFVFAQSTTPTKASCGRPAKATSRDKWSRSWRPSPKTAASPVSTSWTHPRLLTGAIAGPQALVDQRGHRRRH